MPTAIAALVVASIVAGSAILLTRRGGERPVGAGAPLPTATGPGPEPSPLAGPTPFDIPTPEAPSQVPARETGVPDAAMIPELLGLEDYQRGKDYLTYTSPPRPCGAGTHSSDAQLVRARPASGFMPATITVEHPEQRHAEIINEYVAQYRSPTAAAALLAEIRADVRRCPGTADLAQAPDQWRWSVIQTGFAADESLVIRLDALTFRENGSGGPPCCTSYYVAVVRQGQIVVTMTSVGWELMGGLAEIATQGATIGLRYAVTLRS
jgi:hypothetical protein